MQREKDSAKRWQQTYALVCATQIFLRVAHSSNIYNSVVMDIIKLTTA